MFDLSTHTYNDVKTFLEQNYKKKIIKPCVQYEYEYEYGVDLYELIIISIEDEYYDDPNKNFNTNNVLFGKCYYYILEYNDESYSNELSIIDCGGYYIAICIFKNKINITGEIIYNKIKHKDYFTKFHMNTLIGNKSENIPKRY